MSKEPTSAIRVLVVDDSLSARTVMNELLNEAGYTVFSIPSAIGVSQLIHQHSIDAVLVDLNMPGLSGERLITLLRRNPKLQRLIVIVVSGERDEELSRLQGEGKADSVLRKEDIGEPLLRELRRLLAWRGMRGQPRTSPRASPGVPAGASGSSR